jgi:ketosteroid isomerase-like protein
MFNKARKTLAATAIVLAALTPVALAADTAGDEAAILEIWSTYSAARVAGDAETWLGLWDENGIRMAPGAPAVDFATFSEAIPAAFANSQPPSMEIIADEVVIMGDWAFSRGNFTVGDAVDGKFLTVFRRQDDGTWRIYRDAFNMNTP